MKLILWRPRIVWPTAVRVEPIWLLVAMFQWPAAATAGESREAGIILLDMSKADDRIDTTELVEALRLRLPRWRVETPGSDQGVEVTCPENAADHYVLRIVSTSQRRLLATLEGCGDGATLLRERVDGGPSEQESLRQIAVLVPMVLDVAESDGAREPVAEKTARERPVGTLGLAPGLTVAPRQEAVVFTGGADMGVLLVNGLAFRVGVHGSSSYVGVTDKKNLDAEEQVQVQVTDVAFALRALYRFDIGRRWFVALGLGLRYTYSVVRDISEQKFEIEETHPTARGAGVAIVGGGVMFHRLLSVFFEIVPAVSFGPRVYTARGSEAVNLGYGTVGFALGIRFYL